MPPPHNNAAAPPAIRRCRAVAMLLLIRFIFRRFAAALSSCYILSLPFVTTLLICYDVTFSLILLREQVCFFVYCLLLRHARRCPLFVCWRHALPRLRAPYAPRVRVITSRAYVISESHCCRRRNAVHYESHDDVVADYAVTATFSYRAA